MTNDLIHDAVERPWYLSPIHAVDGRHRGLETRPWPAAYKIPEWTERWPIDGPFWCCPSPDDDEEGRNAHYEARDEFIARGERGYYGARMRIQETDGEKRVFASSNVWRLGGGTCDRGDACRMPKARFIKPVPQRGADNWIEPTDFVHTSIGPITDVSDIQIHQRTTNTVMKTVAGICLEFPPASLPRNMRELVSRSLVQSVHLCECYQPVRILRARSNKGLFAKCAFGECKIFRWLGKVPEFDTFK